MESAKLQSDLNQDGKLDVAVANLGASPTSSSVAVLLGIGDGSFVRAQTYPFGSYPIAVAVGDFNGDKAPDIVAANFFGNQQDTVTLDITSTVPAPTILSFTPASGPAGSVVVITGANFINVSAVTFNGVPASNYVVDSDTKITVTAPNQATTGAIVVHAQGGVASSGTVFTVTARVAARDNGDSSRDSRVLPPAGALDEPCPALDQAPDPEIGAARVDPRPAATELATEDESDIIPRPLPMIRERRTPGSTPSATIDGIPEDALTGGQIDGFFALFVSGLYLADRCANNRNRESRPRTTRQT